MVAKLSCTDKAVLIKIILSRRGGASATAPPFMVHISCQVCDESCLPFHLRLRDEE